MKFTPLKIGAILIVVLLGIQSCGVSEEALGNLVATQTALASYNAWYVSSAGSDSNDCRSEATACETIQGAFEKSSLYHHPTIYLSTGHFDIPIDPREGRFIDRTVTIIGDGIGYSIIRGGDESRIRITNRAWVMFEDLSVEGLIVIHRNSSLHLQNVMVNQSDRGGILHLGNELIIENSFIVNTNHIGVDIAQPWSHARITGSVIKDNRLNGITNFGHVFITESRITNNGEAGHGAGIENYYEAVIERSLIDNNEGDYIIYNSPYTGELEPSGSGETPFPIMHLINSTISGNEGVTADGVVIYNQGILEMSYSTIASNTGLGMLVTTRTIETRIENSLFANNSSGNCDFSAQLPILEGNNLDTDRSCFPDMTADPIKVARYLDSLKDNGGPTRTHALLLGSPAIDTAEGSCPATDQRIVSRPVGPSCDVGAFENPIQHVTLPLFCEGIQGVYIRDDGTMRTTVIVPGGLGEYNATLNNFSITCVHYEAYPNTIMCDSPKPQGNTLATLIIFDDQGNEFCNQTFTVPGPTTGQPDKDKDEGCNLSVDICSAQGQSFDENKCKCVDIS